MEWTNFIRRSPIRDVYAATFKLSDEMFQENDAEGCLYVVR
jgi:hypothetical protein